jgi:hypothetical protein
MITLLAKVKDVGKIQQFRPICLLNCLYKWFTKCLTPRLNVVVDRIIHKSQAAFLPGRNIMNNILALHEILHEAKGRRKEGIVLKVDFEKAYDKVHWGFLLQCLMMRGFCGKWCDWIKMVLFGGIVAVKINNKVGPYFQSKKGVRQGDPLYPLLFNFVAACLTRMVLKAQINDRITGLIDNLIPKGVAILQYANDTIMCLENNVENARNVKIILYIYEQMSGLKINFEKSEVLLIGDDNTLALQCANIFNCQIGLFPLKYLGVPISARRLRVIDWAKLEEKSAKKLEVWQGGSLSIGGRIALINSSLAKSTIYHMSMFLLPKTVIGRMEKGRRMFFWQGSKLKKAYHLVKWGKVCKSKRTRGLGVKNRRRVNISLLVKWQWLLETGERLWQDIVRIKYIKILLYV